MKRKRKRDYCVCYKWMTLTGWEHGRTVTSATSKKAVRTCFRKHHKYVRITDIIA